MRLYLCSYIRQHKELVDHNTLRMFLCNYDNKILCMFLRNCPYMLLYILFRKGLRMSLHKYLCNCHYMHYTHYSQIKVTALIIMPLLILV